MRITYVALTLVLICLPPMAKSESLPLWEIGVGGGVLQIPDIVRDVIDLVDIHPPFNTSTDSSWFVRGKVMTGVGAKENEDLLQLVRDFTLMGGNLGNCLTTSVFNKPDQLFRHNNDTLFNDFLIDSNSAFIIGADNMIRRIVGQADFHVYKIPDKYIDKQ